MNTRATILVILLTFAGVANSSWESSILPRGFTHEPSIDKAYSRAAKEQKAVIVYYTRTSCPPCDVLQGRLRNESVAKPFRDGYVFTAVWGNTLGLQEREHYRSRFGVQGAPTWIVFNSQGAYVCTAPGGFSSDSEGLALDQSIRASLISSTPSSSTPVICNAQR